MSTKKRVLLIGGKPQILKKAFDLGISVIFVQKKELYDHSHMQYVESVFLIDFEKIEDLKVIAEAIYSRFPFDLAISTTEFGLVPAAAINEYLSLKKNIVSLKTANILKNKNQMRTILNKNGTSEVKFSLCKEKGDMYKFAEIHGFPFIIKPNSGEGSLGIRKVRRYDDIEFIWTDLKRLGVNEFILEEYLDGDEVSIETFSFNGEHRILAITEKQITENFVEVGHALPARLSEEEKNNLNNLMIKFLNLIDLRDGPAHTEVKLTERGPKIIESHNRRGGDNINELVEFYTGFDMEKYTLGWPLNILKKPVEFNNNACGVASRYFTPDSGIVINVEGKDIVKNDKNTLLFKLNINEGTLINNVNWSKDRVGFVVAKGTSTNDALKNCNLLYNGIKIKTIPNPNN